MTAALIDLEDVSKEFQAGREKISAIDGLSLQIEKGEFVSIMGPSGSGKSTLLFLIGLMEKPSRGIYRLNGTDVTGHDKNQLAELRNRHIGFVFQNFHLLPRLTALENVALPLVYRRLATKLRMERAADVLEALGLRNRVNHYPSQLSGGEQQRVAIARAIIVQPDVLLADEPTGALDSKTGQQTIRLIQGLWKSGQTIVMVTHDPEVAAHATRIIRLKDGRLRSGFRNLGERPG